VCVFVPLLFSAYWIFISPTSSTLSISILQHHCPPTCGNCDTIHYSSPAARERLSNNTYLPTNALARPTPYSLPLESILQSRNQQFTKAPSQPPKRLVVINQPFLDYNSHKTHNPIHIAHHTLHNARPLSSWSWRTRRTHRRTTSRSHISHQQPLISQLPRLHTIKQLERLQIRTNRRRRRIPGVHQLPRTPRQDWPGKNTTKWRWLKTTQDTKGVLPVPRMKAQIAARWSRSSNWGSSRVQHSIFTCRLRTSSCCLFHLSLRLVLFEYQSPLDCLSFGLPKLRVPDACKS